MKYDYYEVELPEDLFHSGPEVEPDQWKAAAIHQAKERARIFTIPCDWQVTTLSLSSIGHTFRVRRRRYA